MAVQHPGNWLPYRSHFSARDGVQINLVTDEPLTGLRCNSPPIHQPCCSHARAQATVRAHACRARTVTGHCCRCQASRPWVEGGDCGHCCTALKHTVIYTMMPTSLLL